MSKQLVESKEVSRAPSKEVEFKNTISLMAPQFKAALPKHIHADKFIRVAQTAILNNPSLLELDRGSLFNSCLKAAADGLMVDGRESAIVSFGGKANYMPMVAGLLKKVRNSGEIATISVNIAYDNDVYEEWTDEKGPHFKHVPKLKGERGEMLRVYAQALSRDGVPFFLSMSKDDVDKVKKSSRSKESGPWVQWYEEMAKKTCLRRLCKYLPMNTDLAMEVMDTFQGVEEQEEVQVRNIKEAEPTRSSRLDQIIASETKPKEEVAEDEVPI